MICGHSPGIAGLPDATRTNERAHARGLGVHCLAMSEEMDLDRTDPPPARAHKRTAEEAGLNELPRRIKPLAEDVVNKIAAGEIIVAPVNALKEMIENSVDAGATSIEILVKDGGLKLLQITDNGHGIERDDLPILCERFTTSKLKAFEDLTSIATYGFRGEALASISHIAHLKVTTKTAGSSCAWQAHYNDGRLTPAKPGQAVDPKPTAGRGGTQITVEDLFYNIPTRRKAFRSASEEYAKILDMVGRYAVHCAGVAFTVKKHGEAGTGISTPAAASTVDRIRQTHGSSVANELIEFRAADKKWGFTASGLCSNANYHVKRTTILLFINHRAVESSAMKKAIEQTYSSFLPKGGHPFVYLSLEIEPDRVDVNVHPTKREVHFLHEDEIIEAICGEIMNQLAKVDTSRTFKTQTLLPGARLPMSAKPVTDEDEDYGGYGQAMPKAKAPKKVYENNLVRTDSKLRKITSMLPASASVDGNDSTSMQYETTDREHVQIRLASVKSLRASVREAVHNGLTEVFATHTYVGLVDDFRRLCAIQGGTKLYLVDYGMISNEFFYQVGLTDFGNFGQMVLEPPPKLVELLEIGAEQQAEEVNRATGGQDPAKILERVPQTINQHLIDRRAMIKEYFSLEITEDGLLKSIPILLKDYTPCLAKLPGFLLRLGPYVNWNDERECFHSFLRELARFYVPEQLPPHVLPDDDSVKPQEDETTITAGIGDGYDLLKKRKTQMPIFLEHVLFPAFKSRLIATNGMLEGVLEVTNLPSLYRVFERC
ncbi:putative dna mismatch repair protein [Phaeomoniella chlamydospora]|uniref:Putative dna mismatch repair protein n=1 Tax=Phaeomoniella chlamydospora TaxID=158046 RepID=A0A0G2ES74_PHACM|nr:putative dna mismatch repair protein [Phaeomoniella chlamydospora]